MTRRSLKVPLWAWYTVAALGFGLMLLARLGDSLGWWNDLGDWLDAVGLILGVWGLAVTVSERTITGLHADLSVVGDKVDTLGAILVRIEALLEARLPRG